jgi:ketosteroid isomerase-like protein
MKKIIFLLLILILLAFGEFAQETGSANPAGEKAIIEKAIRASIGWAVAKDRTLLESLLAHDDGLFIFNPEANSTVGWSQFRKGFDFWMDPRFKMEHYEIRNLRVNLSLSGTVAWWSCILDERASWDGRSIGWKDARWTGVIEKRGNRWLIVQMHFSHASK